jgi:hypothetical protein
VGSLGKWVVKRQFTPCLQNRTSTTTKLQDGVYIYIYIYNIYMENKNKKNLSLNVNTNG